MLTSYLVTFLYALYNWAVSWVVSIYCFYVGKEQDEVPSAVDIQNICCIQEWKLKRCGQLGYLLQNSLVRRHLGLIHSFLSHHGHILHFWSGTSKSSQSQSPSPFSLPQFSFLKQKSSKSSHLSFQYHHKALKHLLCHLPCSSEIASSTLPHNNSF